MLTDVEIAQSAKMKPIVEVAQKVGLDEDDLELYGKYKAKISLEAIKKLDQNEDGKLILVTEKDAARLKNSPLVPESWKKYLYYLPIVIRFYNEQSFNETIKKHIITFPKNNILQNKYE